jgi:hypothetical protein
MVQTDNIRLMLLDLSWKVHLTVSVSYSRQIVVWRCIDVLMDLYLGSEGEYLNFDCISHIVHCST